MEEAGDLPAAVEVVRHGLRAALRGGDLRTPDKLINYARLSVALTNLFLRMGDSQSGLRLVADLRNTFREASYTGSELAILGELVSGYDQLGDRATAAGYAKRSLICGLRLPDWGSLGLKHRLLQDLSSIVVRLAYNSYYGQENYERSAAMTEIGVMIDPGSWAGYWLLGFSRLRLGRFSESIDAFDKALPLNDDIGSKASSQTGRAAAFQGLGDLDGAIEAITEAIALVPDRPHYWWSRATLQAAAGRYDLALADLDETITLAGRDAVSAPGDSREARSPTEYMRDLPARDLKDVASLRRLETLWDTGPLWRRLRRGNSARHSGQRQRNKGICATPPCYLVPRTSRTRASRPIVHGSIGCGCSDRERSDRPCTLPNSAWATGRCCGRSGCSVRAAT